MSDNRSHQRLERRTHFRGRARPGRRVELSYQRTDGNDTAAGETRSLAVTGNIGAGGAFVLTATSESVGTVLRLAVKMPDRDKELELEGEVRWTTPGEPESGGGMGIKFRPLTVEDLLAFSEYLATLSQRQP